MVAEFPGWDSDIAHIAEFSVARLTILEQLYLHHGLLGGEVCDVDRKFRLKFQQLLIILRLLIR